MVQNLDPNMTWPCPRCKVPQVTTAMYCASCGLPLGAAPEATMPLPATVTAKKSSAGGWTRPVILALIIVGVFGYIATQSRNGPNAPPAAAPAAGVPWGDYAATLRSKIDGMGASKDCTGLQAEFDAADRNNAATMSRTGHNNAQLMGYIDTTMRTAGCYK